MYLKTATFCQRIGLQTFYYFALKPEDNVFFAFILKMY